MNFYVSLRVLTLVLCGFPMVFAAPILRVHLPVISNENPNGLLFQDSNTPVWISQGTDGPTDVFFEISNAGDGQVNPQVSAGYSSWLKPAVTGTQSCTFDSGKTCSFVQVLFETAQMSAGTYQGEVTVADNNAVDSPQRIPITIHIDGEVPDSLHLYVAESEGNTDSVEFQTPAGPAPTLTAQSTGQFLSVSSSGLGSFRFLHTHNIKATFSSGMAVGEHVGSVQVSGSAFSQDNRSVQATVHVTDDPILEVGSDSIELNTGPGINPAPGAVVITNRGLGDLSISNVEISAATGYSAPTWLSTENAGNNIYIIRAQTENLDSGHYEGNLVFNSNAANTPVTVSVALNVRDASAPEAVFQGLVNGASFNFLQGIAPGTIVSLFGTNFTDGSAANSSSIPLPQELEGVRVSVNGTDAPLFFVSQKQVNFQVPFELPTGGAAIQATRDGIEGNSISGTVLERSPGIFLLGVGNYGVVVNASQGNFPLPTDVGAQLGLTTTPARPGDVLVIYATGLGPVDQPVSTGEATPSSPLAWTVDRPDVNYSNNPINLIKRAQFAGLSPGSVGLYQVNVAIHKDTPANDTTPVTLQFSDGTRSNTVYIAVE